MKDKDTLRYVLQEGEFILKEEQWAEEIGQLVKNGNPCMIKVLSLELLERWEHGLPISKPVAAALFQAAKDSAYSDGNPSMCYILSELYATGLGVTPDPSKQQLWFEKALRHDVLVPSEVRIQEAIHCFFHNDIATGNQWLNGLAHKGTTVKLLLEYADKVSRIPTYDELVKSHSQELKAKDSCIHHLETDLSAAKHAAKQETEKQKSLTYEAAKLRAENGELKATIESLTTSALQKQVVQLKQQIDNLQFDVELKISEKEESQKTEFKALHDLEDRDQEIKYLRSLLRKNDICPDSSNDERENIAA